MTSLPRQRDQVKALREDRDSLARELSVMAQSHGALAERVGPPPATSGGLSLIGFARQVGQLERLIERLLQQQEGSGRQDAPAPI
jgi:hypothetical protein